MIVCKFYLCMAWRFSFFIETIFGIVLPCDRPLLRGKTCCLDGVIRD